jgi:predicted transcriptional regulator
MKQENEQNRRPEPTRSELEILQVLWKQGPSTVRQVNDTLNEQKRAVQYTSTLKLMQIMVEKNILQRDESAMKHVYRAAMEEKTFKGFLLERFVDSLYDGSASSLMMQLLGNKKPSREELDQIRKMLDQLDKEQK